MSAPRACFDGFHCQTMVDTFVALPWDNRIVDLRAAAHEPRELALS